MMTNSYKILVFDEVPNRLAEIKLILEFLDKKVIELTNIDDLELIEKIKNLQLLSIIFSFDKTLNLSLQKLMAIQRIVLDVPIVLVSNEKIDYSGANELRKNIIGQLSFPFTYSQIANFLHTSKLLFDNKNLSRDLDLNEKITVYNLGGTSKAIHRIKDDISKVAKTKANVIIGGESGTGKEVVARNIHASSSLANKLFIAINCGAIPKDLLESELFGYEKGAFTGAYKTRIGKFELVKDGVLFLDEVGDMPLSMQVKLLRVLEDRTFHRIGSNDVIKFSARVIAATNKNLEKQVEHGKFREDLYYRLNVFPIYIPPLRERVEDIPILIQELINKMQTESRGNLRLLPDAIEALCAYTWPGNVRELANLIERLSILYSGVLVSVNDLPEKFRQILINSTSLEDMIFKKQENRVHDFSGIKSDKIDFNAYMDTIEIELIKRALEKNNWIITRAAQYLNLKRTTLIEKMRKYQLTKINN